MKRWAVPFGRLFLYQRGRVAALALLLLLAALVGLVDADRGNGAGARLAGVVASPPAAVRQWLFDGYQHLFPRVRAANPVAVVAIDENSLKTIGQWPWPRDKLAQLIDAIAAFQPAAIGLDIYMPEPDQTSPEQVAMRLHAQGSTAAAEVLRQLPSHDSRLAQALQAAPTVMGAAGFGFETLTTSDGMRSVKVAVQGSSALPYVHRFSYVLASLPQLQSAAHGQALVSVDESAVVRRIPLVSAVRDELVPSLAMEMLRVASGSEAVEVAVGGHGVQSVRVAELEVPTQSAGDIWLHFASTDSRDARNLSATAVLAGRVDPDALQHKLVLIGLTGLGLNDRRVTPLGENVAGIEIQAQILESLLGGRMLLRPWWMPWVELGLLLVLGGLMVWLVPNALRRSAGVDVHRPRRVGWWVSGVSLAMLAAGCWMFAGPGWLFDGANMSIAFAGVLASLVSSSTLEVERDNRRLALEQQHLREEAARVAGEMEAARRIQLGSLPNAQRAFPGETRFSIDALIEPAREVGGDLYDFFMIDGRRLYFLIGDVSGKGVPASLFMAVTQALTRSFAVRLAGGPAEIVSAANRDLSRQNVETLFVTLLLGVLDVESGVLELVSAGHDAPWRLGADGALEQMATASTAGGPPLCMVDDFAYQVYRVQLRAGDRLCMVTDGITEAADASGQLFGGVRLRESLASLPRQPSSEAITARVREDVGIFVSGAEASDDLAVLVLHWIGPPPAPAGLSAG